jgi:acyl-CoA reductase-like NAD-dependent aldehyde dehydrogenase
MRRAGALLRERKEDLARLMALEMGKPLAQGRAEAEKCAWVCEYYAEHAEAFLRREEIPTDASHSFVQFEPLGIVLAVMPWNYPFWQVFRFLAAASPKFCQVVFLQAAIAAASFRFGADTDTFLCGPSNWPVALSL